MFLLICPGSMPQLCVFQSSMQIIIVGALTLIALANAECPKSLPIPIEGNCYRFQTDFMRFSEATENCKNVDKGSLITSVKSVAVLNRIEDVIHDFVTSKLDNALFWIGLKTDDQDVKKSAGDRTWTWDYDDSTFIQKQYQLWVKDGGPTDKALTCAAINASDNFLVKGVDCSGPRFPVICMLKEGDSCKHDAIPYLMYGDYCLAAISGALEYNKIHAACSPNSPTPYKEEMRKQVIMAAKNSFLGGGLFMNMRRTGKKFYDLSDGSVPDDDWWEEGEPRNEYDCAGLSLQADNTLKLKTMNCEFSATSLCIMESTYGS